MTLALGILAVVLTVLWMTWSIRQAVIARRGPSPDGAAYGRHFEAVGGVARAVAVFLAVGLTALSDGPLLQALPAAVVATVVVAAGEGRWPDPSGQVRRVPLVARRRRDLFPPVGVVLAATAVALTVAVVSICWMVGNTDGRSISRNMRAPDNRNTVVSVSGFPGWTIGVQALVAGVCLLVAAALAARVVIRRPALIGLDAADDLQMRRATMDRLLRLVAITGWVTSYLVVEAARITVSSTEWPAAAPRSDWPFGWVPGVCLAAGVCSLLVMRVRPARAVAAVPGGSRTDQPA